MNAVVTAMAMHLEASEDRVSASREIMVEAIERYFATRTSGAVPTGWIMSAVGTGWNELGERESHAVHSGEGDPFLRIGIARVALKLHEIEILDSPSEDDYDDE